MSPRPAAPTAAGETRRHYHYWTGQSGRQYIHGVYSPEELPHFSAASVVMVVREGERRRALDVAATGTVSELFFHGRRYAGAIAGGVNELHVHLADDPADAAAAAADLAAVFGDAARPHVASRPLEAGVA